MEGGGKRSCRTKSFQLFPFFQAGYARRVREGPVHENAPGFTITRWSMVLATNDSDHDTSRKALAWLCEAYWQPLVNHARFRGMNAHDAQDVVQDFFARLLEKRDLAADAKRGRFRSYLIGALNHFLANHWEKMHALKRGGVNLMVSHDAASQETLDHRTPEQVFARTWAVTVLDRVLERLKADYIEPKRALLFSTLKSALTAEGTAESYAHIGKSLGMSEGAIKVAIHRMRLRYRELLYQEIAETVANPEDIELELKDLMCALRE
jgi:RNA polymerase sigma factor (sigma-70 family)